MTLVLGGTFNPVHLGHAHLARTAMQAMGISRLILLPSYAPVHRAHEILLSYDLRFALLLAVRDLFENAFVSDIERKHVGRAFTIDILPRLLAEERIERCCFAMGLEQFMRLPKWYRGNDIPSLVDIAVLPRADCDGAGFHSTVQTNWPAYSLTPATCGCQASYQTQDGRRRIALLDGPTTAISGSLIRQRWRDRQDISDLVPPQVEALLRRHHDAVDSCWLRETGDRSCAPESDPHQLVSPDQTSHLP